MNPDYQLDRDTLIAAIYRLQTGLAILADQLAKERDFKTHTCTLESLSFAQMVLTSAHPSLARH